MIEINPNRDLNDQRFWPNGSIGRSWSEAENLDIVLASMRPT
jgi:hypothetical protein